MESVSLFNLPVHGPARPGPLIHSFERQLYDSANLFRLNQSIHPSATVDQPARLFV
jgi:hypothetical protein